MAFLSAVGLNYLHLNGYISRGQIFRYMYGLNALTEIM